MDISQKKTLINRKINIIPLIIFFHFLFYFSATYAQKSEIKGIYRGENLYVFNPFCKGGVDFCVYEVQVNGEIVTVEVNSNAFEIDLENLDFEYGELIHVVLLHRAYCKPRFLNPEVLKPKSTYVLKSIKASSKGYVTWTTTDEKGILPFEVQQYRWNKWVTVGTVKGKGTPDKHTYYKSVSFHSGKNKFRIVQKDYSGKDRISRSAEYNNLAAPVTFLPGNGKKTRDKVTFSKKTYFELYDNYGTLVKKGNNKVINLSKMSAGNYFLNYDNTTANFIKK